MIRPFREQFKFTNFSMRLVLNDMNDEDAIKRARNGAGCSFIWIVGHLMHYRHLALRAVGQEKPNPWAEQFDSTPANDGSGYPSVAALREPWNDLAATLDETLQDVNDEQLLRVLPNPNSPHSERTLLDAIVFYTFHEANHMGALSMLRLELGLSSLSGLVVASFNKK